MSRYYVEFEQKPIADIEIDYTRDTTWGWIPTGWRITELLANGTRRLVTEARVTRYSINTPIDNTSFR